MYSNRLRLYLNQIVRLERQVGPDAYGNMQYATPAEVRARKEGHTRLVRNVSGETVTSTTTVFLQSEISPMDMIDGRIVVDAMEMVDRVGNVIGWEAYL